IINSANEIWAQIAIAACPGIFDLFALFLTLHCYGIQEALIELAVGCINYVQFVSIVKSVTTTVEELLPTSFAHILLIFVRCVLWLTLVVLGHVIDIDLTTFSCEAGTTACALDDA